MSVHRSTSLSRGINSNKGINSILEYFNINTEITPRITQRKTRAFRE